MKGRARESEGDSSERRNAVGIAPAETMAQALMTWPLIIATLGISRNRVTFVS